MYQICPNCKVFNSELATECYACRAPLAAAEPEAEPVAVAPSTSDWRQEVVRRLAAYRSRRRDTRSDAEQHPLPFAAGPLHGTSSPSEAAPRPPARKKSREENSFGIAIEVEQPKLNFLVAEEFLLRPDRTTAPVAEMSQRCWAGLLDAFFIVLGFAGFLLIFRLAGGETPLGKLPVAIYAGALFLFYLLYFSLFTFFAGATPGMHLRGLRVVDFSGMAPQDRQLLWRCFGYAVSGLSLCLGFLWALWDEDRLTWQDRISQTYLTAVEPAAACEPGESHTAV
ncbi:MAG: RDD family protein [Firmicutes bacterium]|nr:RDD family protein [Bacillota bacterium]